jgi:hypothetical protein
LGDTVLPTVVGLLKAALDSDDPLWAGYLELGEARLTKEGVVDTREVDNLKGKWLLADVVRLAKGDVESDAPEGHDFIPRHNPVEWCLAGA